MVDDSWGDVESERDDSSDDERLPKKEPFIFSAFGQKLQTKFAQFMADRMGDRSPPLPGTSSQPCTPQLLDDDLGGVMSVALYKVPSFITGRDSRRNVPLLYFLLRATVEYHGGGGGSASSTDNQQPHEEGPVDDPHANYYTLRLQYGQAMQWIIKRRAVDIVKLHYILQWRHLQGGRQGPPRLPGIKALLGRTSEKTAAQLTSYFALLLSTIDGDSQELCEFLEIGTQSIIRPESSKMPYEKSIEGYLRCTFEEVDVEQQRHRNTIIKILGKLVPRRVKYRNRWLALRPSCLLLGIGPGDRNLRQVILFNQHTSVGVENEFAWLIHPFTVSLFTGQARVLRVRPDSRAHVQRWLERLRQQADQSEWCQKHRYGSFAPIRRVSDSSLEWLIDARQYFAKVVEAIEAAKREIFIHGWWVSPELQLIRPSPDPIDQDRYRLDRLLQRKAEEGVRISVIVFKEITVSMAINSLHTKTALQRLHPSIRVLRHPDHYVAGNLYWAHHEKILIVDQQVAFIGGLDLCYGRFDSPEHHLSDQGRGIFTGLDYANPRVREYRSVTDPGRAAVDATQVPRMPWHDVQMRLEGSPAGDLARHFIARWNFIREGKSYDPERLALLIPDERVYEVDEEQDEAASSTTVQIVRSAAPWSLDLPLDTSLYQAHLDLIRRAQHFIYIENQFFISNSGGDDDDKDDDDSIVKNRVAEALVERIITADQSGIDFRVIIVLPLLPAFEAPLDRPEATSCRILLQAQYTSLCRGLHSLAGRLRAAGVVVNRRLALLALRKIGRIDSGLATEQVYVHSKVLIADDSMALIGSANINERSLSGHRDSEIGAIIEGQGVKSLRRRLFAEHLGLPHDDPNLQLPVESDAFFQDILLLRARTNTDAHRLLFHCIPDDSVHDWTSYREFVAQAEPPPDALSNEQYTALSSIQGNLVMFPTEFLRDEDLGASLFTREYLLPIDVYL